MVMAWMQTSRTQINDSIPIIIGTHSLDRLINLSKSEKMISDLAGNERSTWFGNILFFLVTS